MASKNQQNPPALRTISDFKNKLQGGGARPNLFEVVLAFPGDLSVSNNVVNEARFMVKAAALPASNIAPIDVAFRGRLLKVAGDRTFDTWTITVLNDTDFTIRGAFERWMNSINRVTDATGAVNPSEYQADAFVYQLDRDGSVLRKYKFHDVFPTNVSQIDLSYDSSDTLEEFTVELQVLFWTASADNAGGGAGDIN
tara:strand:+ start:4315 stop:4905 length:591 start_codon:yes stop_codon:yes gene_type:complete